MYPENSHINNFMLNYNYKDCYTCVINKSNISPIEVTKLFFTSTPIWFNYLFYLREKLAGLAGLKISHSNYEKFYKKLDNFSGEVGDKIGLFNVYCSGSQEIILGEKDKHLDFCLSFLVIPGKNKAQIFVITTVKFNNWLGKLYFFPVGFIHRIVMKIILNRMEKNKNKNKFRYS